MDLQQRVIDILQVKAKIDPKEEIRNRIDFLKSYIKKTGLRGYVLGISGGQDSTLAGRLTQLAMEELNEEEGTKKYSFYAIRLPYGVQVDEEDAQATMDFIDPYERLTFNIKAAVDAAIKEFTLATGVELTDYMKGNTKARERMKVQYDVAGHFSCLVVGTDHAAESLTGFYTKFGDNACDISPLVGLNKRQGKALLMELNGPSFLYTKEPTADLEDGRPALPDEVALGLTYDDIDDYLEGKTVSKSAKKKIETYFLQSEHKRRLPVSPYDEWWKQS